MTVIAALKARGLVWVAGDAAFMQGWDLSIRPDEKVFYCKQFLIGVAGSPRANNLLKWSFDPPQPQTNNLTEYMNTSFLNGVRKCFTDGGFTEKDNDVESYSSEMLVAILGRLYEIDSGYQVIEVPEYASIGTGSDVALGALYATEGMGPMRRLQIALESAEKFNGAVRGPFQILRSRK